MQPAPPKHARPAAPPVVLPLAAALSALALSWLGPLGYPLRLLSTIVHELAHGLAALLTGGAFLRFAIFPDGSGLAYTAGGVRWLVIPAGYLGAALVGAALIALGRSPRACRAALGALGAATALLTLRYGLPSLLSAELLGGLLAVAAGAGLGAAMLLAALRAPQPWPLFLLNLVAIAISLSALGDLRTLITIAAAGGGDTLSDAHAMARLSLLPAPFWAVAWALIAVASLGLAVWGTWYRPRRGP